MQTATKRTIDPTAGMTVEEEIEYARKHGWNILLPTTNIGGLSEFHKPVTDKVLLSSNPDDKDVYPGKKEGLFVLHAQGLHKLSVCAGITWDHMRCRRTDDRSSRDYVSYQAVGGIRKADGTILWMPGECDLDMEVEEEEIYLGHYNRAQKWTNRTDAQRKAAVEDMTKKDILKKRRFKLRLAETGAMNRVVRKFLSIKSEYTKEELSKPFLVIRIVLQPNFNDADFRRRMMDASIQAITGVYGQPVRQLTAPTDNLDNEDVIDIPLAEEPEATEPIIPEGASPSGNDPTPEEVFESNTTGDQLEILKALAQKKGYAIKNLKFPVEEFTQKHRADFFVMLNGMEDDDIPF